MIFIVMNIIIPISQLPTMQLQVFVECNPQTHRKTWQHTCKDVNSQCIKSWESCGKGIPNKGTGISYTVKVHTIGHVLSQGKEPLLVKTSLCKGYHIFYLYLLHHRGHIYTNGMKEARPHQVIASVDHYTLELHLHAHIWKGYTIVGEHNGHNEHNWGKVNTYSSTSQVWWLVDSTMSNHCLYTTYICWFTSEHHKLRRYVYSSTTWLGYHASD